MPSPIPSNSSEQDRDQLEQKLKDAYELHQAASARSCLQYLNLLTIDSRPEPQSFKSKADPWQWALARKITPAIESVAGVRKDYQGPTSFWLTLPRGHDKTSLIGRMTNWMLAFSKKPLEMVAAAADKEQANFLIEKMQKEAQLNPWLSQLLFFKHHQVRSTRGCHLRVISADAKSNFGLTPDVIVCDELTQWPKQDNWGSLVTAKRKRGPQAVHIVITNAGIKHTWQWEVLQAAKEDPEHWFVYEAPGPICSWMDRAALERDRKTLLPQMARQMIDNEWLDPGESCGFVSKEEAQACERVNAVERTHGLPGVNYIAVIDYGPVKDRTVMAVMHRLESGECVLDRMDVLQGKRAKSGKFLSRQSRVPIEAVEDWIDRQRANFNLVCVVFDEYQMESTIQKYERILPVERFKYRGGQGNYEMGQALRHAILNQQISWPRNAGAIMDSRTRAKHRIADELAELIVKQLSYGYRIDHLPNKHDDRSVVLGMGLLALLKRPAKSAVEQYESDLWW